MIQLHNASPLPDTMFTLSQVGDIAVLGITCPALLDDQAAALAPSMRDIALQSGGRMLIDLAGVGRFSCAWINALIELTRTCRNMGGELIVVNVQSKAKQLLRSSELDRHLHLGSSRAAAFQALGHSVVAPWRLAIARLLDIPVGQAA